MSRIIALVLLLSSVDGLVLRPNTIPQRTGRPVMVASWYDTGLRLSGDVAPPTPAEDDCVVDGPAEFACDPTAVIDTAIDGMANLGAQAALAGLSDLDKAKLRAALEGPAKNGKKIVLAHGWYPRHPWGEEKWHVSLQKHLESKGCTCVPDMNPAENVAPPEAHIKAFADLVGEVDENTYFVAFSMGNHVTMRFLQTLAEKKIKIGGYIAVGCWMEPRGWKYEPEEAAKSFTALTNWKDLDKEKLNAVVPKMMMLIGKKDPVVFANTEIGQTKNIENWKSVFGDKVEVQMFDFIKDAQDDGEKKGPEWDQVPAYLFRDHLVFVDLDKQHLDVIDKFVGLP